MADPYTIVLWCADASRLSSFAGAHLLHQGLIAANSGRVGDEIPVAVGVANARRWPIVSREVSARGVLRARRPRVATQHRIDYLLTFASGTRVDAGGANLAVPDTRVIPAVELVERLERVSPSNMPKNDIVALFAFASLQAQHAAAARERHVDLRHVADLCQRLVAALNR